MLQIKEHLDAKTYDLCQEKLKEFNLTKDPEFVWCADVSLNALRCSEQDNARRAVQTITCHQGHIDS